MRLGLNDSPDEEGIKTRAACQTLAFSGLNDSPDEEGIKTIKINQHYLASCLNDSPDEEGIKTGWRVKASMSV